LEERTANLVGGVSGILYVLLWVVGFFIIVGFVPTLGSSEREVAEFLGRSSTRIWAGGYLALLGFVFLIVFVARLAAVLRRAEGDRGWLWSLALVAALAWVSIEMATAATEGAAFYAGSKGLDLQTTTGLINVGNFGFFLSGAFGALFLAATAFVVLRTEVLPRWLGWFAAILAAASIVAVPIATTEVAQIPVLLRAVWVVAVSVVLISRRETMQPLETES
jgi:hypothetical protein